MRVLVVAAPVVGHVLPVLPLAGAVEDAGHEVVLATGPEGMPAARSTGIQVREVAPDPVNDGVLARAGAGLAMPAARIGPRDLQRLATDDDLAAAARGLAAEIAAMPSPRDVVPDLAALAR